MCILSIVNVYSATKLMMLLTSAVLPHHFKHGYHSNLTIVHIIKVDITFRAIALVNSTFAFVLSSDRAVLQSSSALVY